MSPPTSLVRPCVELQFVASCVLLWTATLTFLFSLLTRVFFFLVLSLPTSLPPPPLLANGLRSPVRIGTARHGQSLRRRARDPAAARPSRRPPVAAHARVHLPVPRRGPARDKGDRFMLFCMIGNDACANTTAFTVLAVSTGLTIQVSSNATTHFGRPIVFGGEGGRWLLLMLMLNLSLYCSRGLYACFVATPC